MQYSIVVRSSSQDSVTTPVFKPGVLESLPARREPYTNAIEAYHKELLEKSQPPKEPSRSPEGKSPKFAFQSLTYPPESIGIGSIKSKKPPLY